MSLAELSAIVIWERHKLLYAAFGCSASNGCQLRSGYSSLIGKRNIARRHKVNYRTRLRAIINRVTLPFFLLRNGERSDLSAPSAAIRAHCEMLMHRAA